MATSPKTSVPDLHPDQRESDRRFTDQEIALVLKHAAEIEEGRTDAVAAHGVTLRELREIASDVGIRPDVFEEAVSAVQAGALSRSRDILGAPLSSKAVRGVPGPVGETGFERLLSVVEAHTDATGTITEALGTVRWTSIARDHRFGRTMQVSLTAKNHETQIHVVQRYPSALRSILHFLPGVWGGALGVMMAASIGVTPVALIGSGVGVAVLGVGVGRWIWQLLARRSEREVQSMAGELAATAREMAQE